MLASVVEDPYQLKFDHGHTAIHNLSLYCSLISVSALNHSRNLGSQAILGNFSSFKAITDEDINAFGITELICQMMSFLPIGSVPDLSSDRGACASGLLQTRCLF